MSDEKPNGLLALIGWWSERLYRSGMPAEAVSVGDEMARWLKSPAARFVPVEMEKIEALRLLASNAWINAESTVFGYGHNSRIITVEDKRALDDLLACAAPPNPKDAILEALKDAQHLLQTGDPRVIPHVSVSESYKRSRAAVDRAIELREREIGERR